MGNYQEIIDSYYFAYNFIDWKALQDIIYDKAPKYTNMLKVLSPSS